MVHFVGAGSGAADLITVRGARLLGRRIRLFMQVRWLIRNFLSTGRKAVLSMTVRDDTGAGDREDKRGGG